MFKGLDYDRSIYPCAYPTNAPPVLSPPAPALPTHLHHPDVRRAVEVRPDLLQAGVEQPRVRAPVRADLATTSNNSSSSSSSSSSNSSRQSGGNGLRRVQEMG